MAPRWLRKTVAAGACAVLMSGAVAHADQEPAPLADGQIYNINQPAPSAAPSTQAPLSELSQPPSRTRSSSTPRSSAQARSFGAARGPQSAAPSMIGDFFGGGSLQIFVQPPSSVINSSVTGFGAAPSFTAPGSSLLFATDPNGPPVLTAGPGSDATGDGFLDTWVVENVPPQFVPPPPGPGQIVFNNGSVVAFTKGSGVPVDGRPEPSPIGGPFAPGFQLLFSHTFIPDRFVIHAPNPSGGGGVGRVKIAENNSPIPRDRVFTNYSLFNQVPLTAGGVDVNRFVPGFEKTFYGGIGSIEMRFPFATTLDNVIYTGAVPNTDEAQFGNIGIPIKLLLFQNQSIALAGGMQIALPTARDTIVQQPDGTQLVRIENESVHLMPYLGLLLTPNDRLFMQSFVQVDADTQGSPVQVTNFAGGLNPAGRLDDVTYLYVDLSLGYWLFRSNDTTGITGVAPTFEVHMNRALDDAPTLQNGPLLITSSNAGLDSTNLVLGAMFEWSQRTTLTVGCALPVSGDFDRQFDSELRVIFNHRFGPQSRATRAQF